MRTFPIDARRVGTFSFIKSAPVVDQNGIQKTRDNSPIFKLYCLVIPPKDGDYEPKPELLEVSVPDPHNKIPSLKPVQELVIKDLVATPWDMNGRSGISFRASGFSDAPASVADLGGKNHG